MDRNFWKKSNEDDYFVCAPFLDEDLKRIETRLGYTIPESYRSLMSMRNGGLLRNAFFPLRNDRGEITRILRCESLLGIADSLDKYCLLGRHRNHVREGGKTIGPYGVAMDGFQIGEWCPNSGWGNTYVHLDFSLCGPEGEPRVCAYEMKWSAEHKKAMPIPHVLAPSFAAFAAGLTTRPSVEPFDFEAFESRVVEGAKETLKHVLEEIPGGDIRAFGLYTDNGEFVSTSIDTIHHTMLDNPYLTSEWALEGTKDAAVFSELTGRLEDHVAQLVTDGEVRTFRNKLIDCCVGALLKLKESGFFRERLGKDILLMVGTSHADLSLAQFNKIKKALNPRK